jgi:PHD/YefM family antitoxin component YafN of YafNO toxin-antitoxin module
MAKVSATEAKNKIGELWALAEVEPVTVERNGVSAFQIISTKHYVAVPIEEYDRLKENKPIPKFGFAKDIFKGVDTDALLAVDILGEFEEYL